MENTFTESPVQSLRVRSHSHAPSEETPTTVVDTPDRVALLRTGLAGVMERARVEGAATLSDDELLLVLVGALTGEDRPQHRVQRLLSHIPLHRLAHARIPEVVHAALLGPREALGLLCAAELASRLARPPLHSHVRIKTAADVAALVGPRLVGLPRERMMVLLLDQKHGLLSTAMVSEGWIEGTVVDPREVFRPALAERASAVILVHNHPSGDPTPSRQDKELTRRLHTAAEALGLRLVDHVVVASQGHRSVLGGA